MVWDDQPANVLFRAKDMEDQLISTICNPSTQDEKTLGLGLRKKSKPQTHFYNPETSGKSHTHDEIASESPRKAVLLQPLITAVTILLMIAAIGTGVRRMMIEFKIDHKYSRFRILIVAPLQIWLALVSQRAFIILQDITDR